MGKVIEMEKIEGGLSRGLTPNKSTVGKLRTGMAKLKAMGVGVRFQHRNNPVAEIPPDFPGHGEREVTQDLAFHKGDHEPTHHYGEYDENTELYARCAHGYTTCIVTVSDGTEVYGHAICSVHDHYNGNVGALLSLSRALKKTNLDVHSVFNS